MFDKFLQASLRRHFQSRLLVQLDLLAFQLVDPFLIRLNHRRTGGFDDAVEQRFDLSFDILGLGCERALLLPRFRELHVPCVNEHSSHQLIELFGGL
ncbi:hypothetical protein M8756_07815 [Lutimaribacter sp. EGI FJ00015]|uniref:Uncharacterized protein n=1 Tax=Lutimaribacter degradans TaxID=2945989 RepID=A0ACC5ZVG2_9RHOB|nr:hypothetical protein [Lutimaribacter sp. EGI FJ00013]MCM2561756.1 hypothetical protein [Lutimaribacter sp. EGI FJ00013]MCO0613212.1 hypothetical protein [Lutimaribacter sp. EGI FJ00015]MCO0635588.1 hypothetical protein [Lutimaribacter sp. EGI FJ00014]